ncbi:MAG: hypothetical protein DA328_07935 [Nitrososphaeraceae archaeon]|nr:hypothetical protein [Nitrososphaeraceae archaeon]
MVPTEVINNLPEIPEWMPEIIHNVGLVLLQDDIHDIGYFQYYHRQHHYYNGKKSPKHPSPFHHWQIGLLMLVGAQFAGLLNQAKQLAVIMKEDNEINYNDYMKEINDNNRVLKILPFNPILIK